MSCDQSLALLPHKGTSVQCRPRWMMERCSEVRSARRGRPAGCWCLAGGRHARQAQALDRSRQGRSIIMQGRRCELRGWAGHGHRARWRQAAGGSHQPAAQCPHLPQHSPSPPLCPASARPAYTPYVEPEMPSSWKSNWCAAMIGPCSSQAQAQAHNAGGRGPHACIASAGLAGWCASWACLPHESMSECDLALPWGSTTEK